MQINRQANSSARAKGFVNRTKDLLSAFTTSFKYPELKVRLSFSQVVRLIRCELLTFLLGPDFNLVFARHSSHLREANYCSYQLRIRLRTLLPGTALHSTTHILQSTQRIHQVDLDGTFFNLFSPYRPDRHYGSWRRKCLGFGQGRHRCSRSVETCLARLGWPRTSERTRPRFVLNSNRIE